MVTKNLPSKDLHNIDYIAIKSYYSYCTSRIFGNASTYVKMCMHKNTHMYVYVLV